MPYQIEFAESVKAQLMALSARQRAVVVESIAAQLRHEPLVETHKRKLLRPNPIAPWELRVGSLRVFYEVDAEEPDTVRILAVGEKRGNRILIADKEIKL